MAKTFPYFLAFFTVSLHAQTPVDSTALRQVDSLLAVVKQQVADKQYAEALATNAAAEKLALETFGRRSLTYANCCYYHARILEKQWNKPSLQEGLQWASESLDIRQEILGDSHVECARSHSMLASLNTILRQYDQVLVHAQEARRIFEGANQTDDSDYRLTLRQIAIAHSSMGNYAEGEGMFLFILQHIAKREGKESREYAQVLSNLANQSNWVSNYEKCLQYGQEAANIYEKTGGQTDVYYAFCLRSMGQANMSLKRYAEAEKQLLKALDIVEKTAGKNDSRYADVLSMTTMLYNKMKAYDKALPLLIESLERIEKSMGKQNNGYIRALSNLATAYIESGQLQKGEPLLLEATDLQEKHIHGNVELQIMNNLASLYRMTGRFVAADSLCGKIDVLSQQAIIQSIHYMSEAELQQYVSKMDLHYSAFSLAHIAALSKALPPDIAGTCYCIFRSI